jgi:hypothetical protein
MTIAQRLTHRWRPKLACLLLASGLWWVIKQNVKQTPVSKPWPDPAAATQSRR